MVSRAQRDQYAAQLRQVIAEHGWAIQMVHGDLQDPPFSYTVGLTEAGLPELIILGLPTNVAGQILNKLARQSLESELDVDARYDLPNGDATLPYLIGSVSTANVRRYLKLATVLYDRHRIRALQVIWPSKEGRFPQDPGWDLQKVQPVLA
ncbi:DUF4262 domain-containing protein [Hamadaea sp. NPDC050747]|uniref:DUF4262 domain-containing protein n=1 Tax=Hamadaea sp. NPDC050747 TaxID=3155789 RepID=UPI0033F6C22E